MSKRLADNIAVIRKLTGGLLMGITFLLPGVSGGALAVSLGYFEPTIAAISSFFKNPRKSIVYLLPLGIGGLVGIALSAGLIVHLMNNAETQAVSLFFGMVAGSLPSLFKDANPVRPKPIHLWPMLLGLLLTLPMLFLETAGARGTAPPVTLSMSFWSGAICGIGTVIPGISSSFYLIYLNWYTPVVNAMVAFDFGVILFAGAGFVCAALVLVKVADFLFKRYRANMLNLVMGLLVGSLLLVFPVDFFVTRWWLNILLALIGLAGGLYLGSLGSHEKKGSTQA